MNKHAWVIDLIDDLTLYAQLSNLTVLQVHLEHLRPVVVEDIRMQAAVTEQPLLLNTSVDAVYRPIPTGRR